MNKLCEKEWRVDPFTKTYDLSTNDIVFRIAISCFLRLSCSILAKYKSKTVHYCKNKRQTQLAYLIVCLDTSTG